MLGSIGPVVSDDGSCDAELASPTHPFCKNHHVSRWALFVVPEPRFEAAGIEKHRALAVYLGKAVSVEFGLVLIHLRVFCWCAKPMGSSP
jgi:hypothetical protein